MIKKLKPKSEFSRNVLTMLKGTTIAQAITIAISPLLTRIYTPEDFGTFALFLAVIGALATIVTGRYELAMMIPKRDGEAINIFALGLSILLFSTFFLTVFIILFHDSLINFLNNAQLSFWFYFIPIAVFFTGIFNLLSYFNNRKKNYRDISNAMIVKSVTLSCVQLCIGFIKEGVSGLIIGQIMSILIANIKLLKNMIKDKSLITKINILKVIVLARKYKKFPKFQAPHALLNTFSSNIPIYLFSLFFSSTVVGFYALSIRIVYAPFMIISGASSKVYSQRVTEIYNENGDTYFFTIKILKSLSKKIIFPFLIIVIFAPNIFAFVFGETWREAGIYTQILSPWLFMVFIVSVISFITSLLHLQKKALVLEIVYTLLRIISIGVGVYLNDLYIALALFSFVGFFMLTYNLIWMLNSLKRLS